MSRYYPTPDELTPGKRELEAQRKAAASPGMGQAWGSGIGGVAGGALGALGLLGGPGLAAITIPAGAAAGSALGGAIGGTVGNAQADEASEILNDAEAERQKKLAAFQLRQQALQQLLSQR